MNIHKRFMVHFFGQLLLSVSLLGAFACTLFATIGFVVMEEEIKDDLSSAESHFFAGEIEVKEGKLLLKEELKSLVRKQNGWLVVYNSAGDPVASYLTPKFTEKEILKQESSDDYHYWNTELSDSQSYTLLFGKHHPTEKLIQQAKENIEWSRGMLSFSANTIQIMEKEKGWSQLVDSNGKVIDAFNAEDEPASYSYRNLIRMKNNKNVSTFTDESSDRTLLVGTQIPHPSPTPDAKTLSAFSNGGFIVLLIILSFLLIATLLHARKFGVPLLTMMKWIQNLSDGIYEEPLDGYDRPIMSRKNGRLKRKYRFYKDFIANLSYLTEILRQNKHHEKQMVVTREEWISGISHDLKTPLSSISGYAHMLRSDTYSWTEDEIRKFAAIITEKSEFMKELLDDLTLTYRLKNHALPISKERTEMNEVLRRTVIQFINNQDNKDKQLSYKPLGTMLYAEVDRKWFQRILDNVLSNAVKYNPVGTEIVVSLRSIENQLMVITIKDDGKGMDNESLNKLFQRYYRGTSTTERTSGSGLGMAITKQLIELHGGSINVTSVPGRGTKVRIMVPM
ncbi:HAMP domain-containing sensor histidine kinase [Rossellomorea sp. YZS02]|uniref:sensor histidine kinase n=1 Tax=Rossellomorea sp. YZS02 TaxID=3097358 RepID=UPI002A0B8A84|nr:HAMP domain-containing sensor histidine kinase [Rossellomorea sp. YZS02]MDX8342350.1 HAMP domain-containing sensor histidine kinase [Rossellomorea sp. YZS02]